MLGRHNRKCGNWCSKNKFAFKFVLLQFKPRQFDENVDEKVYRQRHRVPRQVVDLLETKFPELEPARKNPFALTGRQKVLMFVHLNVISEAIWFFLNVGSTVVLC
jgi:hypothetical protein